MRRRNHLPVTHASKDLRIDWLTGDLRDGTERAQRARRVGRTHHVRDPEPFAREAMPKSKRASSSRLALVHQATTHGTGRDRSRSHLIRTAPGRSQHPPRFFHLPCLPILLARPPPINEPRRRRAPAIPLLSSPLSPSSSLSCSFRIFHNSWNCTCSKHIPSPPRGACMVMMEGNAGSLYGRLNRASTRGFVAYVAAGAACAAVLACFVLSAADPTASSAAERDDGLLRAHLSSRSARVWPVSPSPSSSPFPW